MNAIRPSRALIGIAAALSLALAAPLALPPAPTDAASAKACKVANVTRGGSYTSLVAAVKKARDKDRLTVRGTCYGRTRITNKKLTIVGVSKSGSGVPTLKSTAKGPVLSIDGDFANVTVKKLLIKGRTTQLVDYDGGGISLGNSKLTLKYVTIEGFRTKGKGGGIHNLEGTLEMIGSTKIRNNEAGSGSGIYNNSGTVVMRGTSIVRANNGTGIYSDGPFARVHLYWDSSVRGNSGGGIYGGLGKVTMSHRSVISGNTARQGGGFSGNSLTMNDKSSITANTATETGGGVFTGGTLTMKSSSSITANTALQGGGVYFSGGSTKSGVRCDPDPTANVYGNTPDQCFGP